MQPVSISDDISRIGLGQSAAAQPTGGDLGQQDFLTLMIAQFRNQDPFKPMNNGEFLGQLAQFGTVDGIERLNTGFTGLSQSLNADQVLQATNLVGHTVLAVSDSAYLPAEGNFRGAVELSSSAQNVQVDITDSSGQLIRRMDLGQRPAGLVDFQWDGLTDGNKRAAEGRYSISARAIRGVTVEGAQTLIKADIASVNLGRQGKTMTLNVAGGDVLLMNQIRSIL